ncbi:MAG: UbiD family decarboxylase [Proteobacteria bacterium]|nr:UbiD family decarboxylase [Pseudomonadota bacterium]
MAQAFREFLRQQEEKGDILRIRPQVDTISEMGAVIARADYDHVDKGLLFENPKGFDIPVFANTIGGSGYRRIADTFGVPLKHAVPGAAQKMRQALAGNVPPVYVDRGAAPCKELVFTGADIDLTRLPILRLNPADGSDTKEFLDGRFVCGVACTKPAENAYNLSYHRFEITGRNKGSVWIFRGTGDAKSMEEFWGAKIDDRSSTWNHDKARAFPMAFVIGVGPDMVLAAANAALPHKNNDFAYVGALTGEPVKLVKCETIDVDVPADAEIVIEGVFKPFDWVMQGRFASFNGFYDDARRRPAFHVTAITMRRQPIYQHVHIGRPLNECNNIAAFFRSVRVYVDLAQVLPNVVDVFVDPAAGCGFTVHVAIDKRRIGEPRMAMMRAYTALQGFCKHVFVYDKDIDIHNPHERDWALAHRFMADRDLLVIPNVIGMTIDPLAQADMGATAKLGVYDGHDAIVRNTRTFMGVDCTAPLGLKMMERVIPDPAIEASVDRIWHQIAQGGAL